MSDIIGRLYQVAEGDEHAVLDALIQRAGFQWRCANDEHDLGFLGPCEWNNPADANICGCCGAARPTD